MKKIILIFVFILVSVTANASTRIISLAPNITEILYIIGAGKQIVAVSAYSNYPKAAKKLPIVTTYNDLDLERIIHLKPNFIVVWKEGNPSAQIRQLKGLHIKVVVLSFQKISDIPHAMLVLGQLTGHEQQAKRQAKKFEKSLKQLKQKYSRRKKVTVFYQLSQDPLMTLNKHSMVDQMIQVCGGENIFHDTIGLAPMVNIESILARNPQAILISNTNKAAQQEKLYWQEYPMLQAVKNKQIFIINADLIERPGPRLIQGITQICQYLSNS